MPAMTNMITATSWARTFIITFAATLDEKDEVPMVSFEPNKLMAP
jgi:hypothetical protein